MQRGNLVLALKGLGAGIMVGLMAWLVLPNSSGSAIGIPSLDGGSDLGRAVGSPAPGRAVGTPSIPFGGQRGLPEGLSFLDPTDELIFAAPSGTSSLPNGLPDIVAEASEDSSTTADSESSSAAEANSTSNASGNTPGSSTANSNTSLGTTNRETTSPTPSTQAPRTTTPTSNNTGRATSPTTTSAPRATAPTTTRAPAPTTTRAPVTTTTRAPAPTTTAAPPVNPSPGGQNIYVDDNGNDSNNGTQQSPVRSFSRAAQLVEPGDSIVFQAGTHDPIRITDLHGTAQNPIRIVGRNGAEFRSATYNREAGIRVTYSSNIQIVGVTIRHALWGVYIEGSHDIDLLNSDIDDIGQEAVRIKNFSSNVLVEGNRIANTGRRTDNGHANGEGVYIGTGTPGNIDAVTNVTVRNNTITGLTDEAIDIKIPTTNILIEGNTISNVHTQTTGAIVAHLNSTNSADPNIVIRRNTVQDVTRSSPYNDGNCIVIVAPATVTNNTLRNCQHRGIFTKGMHGTATITGNTLVNTGSIGPIVDEGHGMSVVNQNNTIR